MAKLIDETGNKYGKLTVIRKVESTGANSHAKYECRCDCGNTVYVLGSDLRRGHTVSCGCAKKDKSHDFDISYVGKVFGKLTVIEPDDYRNGKYYWKCRCECGEIISTSQSNLQGGKSTQCVKCGNKARANTKAEKLVKPGDKFGKLTVLEKVPSPNPNRTNAYYKCKCDCGNEIVVEGRSLRSGKTKSCGCYRKEVLTDDSIIGKKFGMLTILSIDHIERSGTGSVKYVKCKCDCGNEKVIRYSYLVDKRPGHSIVSCGCTDISTGEKLIELFLRKNNITYSREYKFKDLYDKSPDNLLRYDFAVKSRNGKQLYFLIEFDGVQHYQEVSYFNKSSLAEVQKRDALKTAYARNHNIPLLRIPYWDINNINTILTDFIKNNFSNSINLKQQDDATE